MVLTGSQGEPGHPGLAGAAGPVGLKGKVKGHDGISDQITFNGPYQSVACLAHLQTI